MKDGKPYVADGDAVPHIKAALEAKQEALASAEAGRVAADQATTAAGALAIAAEVDAEAILRRIESRVLEVVNKRRNLDP